jgi:ankyrin repeat protein
MTALHYAAKGGQAGICEILIKKAQQLVNMQDFDGNTPLMYAVDCSDNEKSLDTVNVLLNNHAKTTLTNHC